ncbi:MAG: GIY-YIG nuclease family protein, partial [Planctomycetia bacterium]|nr:GIY-YIG nuclease family protein [Planctomycetia bacterium]
PPFDTLGPGEIFNRLARGAGLLDMVAREIPAAPGGGLAFESMAKIAGHIPGILAACATIRADLGSAPVRPEVLDAEGGRRGAGGPDQRLVRAPVETRLPGSVASARGLVGKCARDLPRLLRESPPTGTEVASMVTGLGRMEVAAGALDEAVRANALPAPRGGTSARPGGSAAKGDATTRPGTVRVVEAGGGPDARGGTYAVVFRLGADAGDHTVGALGTFDFEAGFYCYIGSAFGPGGVRARTARHRAQNLVKKLWNIDHMKPPFEAVEVWWTNDPTRRECSWSAVLASTPGFCCPAPGFGSHDCRVNRADGVGSPGGRLCRAHLYRSTGRPDVADFARRLGRLVPGHAPVYRQELDHRGFGDG